MNGWIRTAGYGMRSKENDVLPISPREASKFQFRKGEIYELPTQ